jgi:gluconolactonase
MSRRLDGGSPGSGGAGFADAGAVTCFVMHDERFADVLGEMPTLAPVVETEAHEGPVYSAAEDALYFTTVPRRDADGIPHVSIERLDLDSLELTTVREDANVANGMFLDHDGALVVCEQGTRRTRARISRVDPHTGDAETIVDSLGGFRLNSPNDVVVRSDGTIWFTDPSYGHLQGFRPRPELGDLVYRYDPRADRLTIAADSFDKPNGLAFSPDEDVLYVADNGRPHHLVSYEVGRGGRLQRRRVLAAGTPEHPDGLKVDSEGRIYASSSDGIRVHDPSGLLLGQISLPGAVNFTFGGPDSNVLYITADTAIWAATLNAKGASPWHSSAPAEPSTTQARRLSPTPQPLMPAFAEAVSSSPW